MIINHIQTLWRSKTNWVLAAEILPNVTDHQKTIFLQENDLEKGCYVILAQTILACKNARKQPQSQMNFVTPTKFEKKADFWNLASKKPIWQPCMALMTEKDRVCLTMLQGVLQGWSALQLRQWVINFISEPLYCQGRCPQYPLNRWLDGSQGRSAHFEELNLLPLHGFET